MDTPAVEEPTSGSPSSNSKANKKPAGFGERLLRSYGLSKRNFQVGGFTRGTLDIFNEAGENQDQNTDSGLPQLEKPERILNKSNANISTIIDQLVDLIEIANKISMITREQQNALVDSIKAEKAKKQEYEYEKKDATALDKENLEGESIEQLNDSMVDIIKSIRKLINVVDEKTKESNENKGFTERLADSYGMGDEYRKLKKAKELTTGDSGGGGSKKGKILKGVAKVAAGLVIGGGTAYVATKLMSGSPAAASITESPEAKIKNIAKPLIDKAFGNITSKRMSFTGNTNEANTSIDKLLLGDKSQISKFGGFGGPLLSTPAIASSISRDVYFKVYGVQPEKDPDLESRMPMIKNSVNASIKQTLLSNIEPKNKPTIEKANQQTLPNMAESVTKAKPINVSESPKPTQVGEAPASIEANQASTQQPEVSSASSGFDISTSSIQNENVSSNVNVVDTTDNLQNMAQTQTTNDSAIGWGNVPDPNYYDYADLIPQLYFEAAV